jgi:hypothetical protein
VQALRKDAIELRERASEYLTLWGGDVTVIGAGGSISTKSNEPRQVIKARYEEMVSALQQARDVATPLLTALWQLEGRLRNSLSAADLQALRPDVQRASSQEKRVVAELDIAVAKLDEVKSLATAAASGNQ